MMSSKVVAAQLLRHSLRCTEAANDMAAVAITVARWPLLLLLFLLDLLVQLLVRAGVLLV